MTWTGRNLPQSDLGYFETQLGTLNDNSGNRIVFHTGIFYDNLTQWTGRNLLNN